MHGYKINKEHGLLVIKCAGEVTVVQLAEPLISVLRDPDYSLGMNILTDLRGLTSSFSYQELHELVDGLNYRDEIVRKAKSAILVSKDVTYGIGRVWASITEHKNFAETQVFWTLEEALEWLGLPPDAEIEFPF
jgi:hypothetical protein